MQINRIAAAARGIKPAERWAGLLSALVLVLSLSGVPSRLGLTTDDVAALLTLAGMVAVAARSAVQALRHGGVQALDSVDLPPELVAAIRRVGTEAARQLLDGRGTGATFVETPSTSTGVLRDG